MKIIGIRKPVQPLVATQALVRNLGIDLASAENLFWKAAKAQTRLGPKPIGECIGTELDSRSIEDLYQSGVIIA